MKQESTTTSRTPRPALTAGQRVGVYGGSFDPIHSGHVEPVLAAIDVAELDHILFLPTAYPPHKSGVEQVDAEHRFEMVSVALKGLDRVSVLDDELTDARAFTVDTLQRLDAEFPDVAFLLIVGADSYHELTQWKDWQRIVARWDLVVLPRPGWSLEEASVSAALLNARAENPERKHFLLDRPLCEASSTEIRRRIEAGEQLPAGWVKKPVLDFIKSHGLYQSKAKQSAKSEHSLESEAGLTTTPAVESDRAAPKITIPLPREVALAAYTALDRQAIDLVLLEVTEVCDFADYFIICSGNTDRQVSAISDAIQRALRKIKVKALHVEGQRRGNWVLVDYGHLIVHIFDPATRDFYRLERLWDDAPKVPQSLYAEAAPSTADAPAEPEQ